MSTTTPNFGWQVPTSTDYVKDGAVAIETLGDAIDASLADLKGGTTGQVLSKATNTDMDFAWVTPDDADAIQNTIVDAKGDLISATAADTPARLAVGTNGQVLTADSTTATGLKWASGGGMTLLANGSFAGAAVTVSAISSAYRDLVIYVRNYKPSNDGEYLRFRFNADSTANRHVPDYQTLVSNLAFSEVQGVLAQANDNSVANGLAVMTIFDYANTSTWKMAVVDTVGTNQTTTTNANYGRWFTIYNQTAAISSLYFYTITGNPTSGDYYIYGVN